MNRLLSCIMMGSLTWFGFSQNLDKIGEKEMVTVSGGISSNLIYNDVQGQAQFRDPFSWMLTGNVTVNMLDVSLPFTFSFSNVGRSYSQPFNMTALHPTYKKWKAHLGITSMQFSPYTYQGMNFTGGGLEYAGKDWKFKGFGGQLRKAIEYDAAQDNTPFVAYQRFGFGFSTEYAGKLFGSELIVFKGFDDPTSLQFPSNNPQLTAKDNLVLSLKASTTLFKSLQLKTEIASSILTQDILMTESSPRSIYTSVVQGNQTTIVSNAYNTSLDYRYKTAGIGLKYERIDPGYSTLGTVYFNDDLENITLNPSLSAFTGKMMLSGSIGFQRNNLKNNEVSHNQRWIGSANISVQVFKGFNWNANYSNMSSFSKRNPAADPFYTTLADTLNFYQVSQNVSSTFTYSFGDSIKQSLNLTGSYSQSQNITGRLQDAGAFGFNVAADTSSMPVDLYNAVFGHRIQLPKAKISIGWTINANHSLLIGTTSTYIGPGINASKTVFDKKLALTAATTYNRQYANGDLTNHVMNYRIGTRYSPQFWDKKYGTLSMNVNGTMTNRLPVIGQTKTQNLTIMASIAYQF